MRVPSRASLDDVNVNSNVIVHVTSMSTETNALRAYVVVTVDAFARDDKGTTFACDRARNDTRAFARARTRAKATKDDDARAGR